MNQPTKPDTDAGYLEQAARIIFMGGLNRQVVDSKWPGFRDAFHGFEVERVADMTPEDIEALASDDRVIKYKAKLEAVVKNARQMAELADEHGAFADYVDQLYDDAGVKDASKTLSKQFSYISEQGAEHWLYATGYDIGDVSEKVQRKYAPFQEA